MDRLIPVLAALIAAVFFYTLFLVSVAEPHEYRSLYGMDIESYLKYERTQDFCMGQFPKTHHTNRVTFFCRYYSECMQNVMETRFDCATDSRSEMWLEKGSAIDCAIRQEKGQTCLEGSIDE